MRAERPIYVRLELTNVRESMTVTRRVYLDWNATTPLRPEARRAMQNALDVVGNPSSIHAEGRAARKLVEAARLLLADATGVDAASVVFTSGGTEANAMALQPLRRSGQPTGRLVVSAIEHASVLSGGRFGREQAEFAPVTADGVVDLDALRALLAGREPALVSVMLANNETGVIQPIRELAAIVHDRGGLLHVDAVQALGKIPLDARGLGADLVSVSAHKLGGPKGVGALILAGGDIQVPSLIPGGGQERNRRGGTENVVGIAGFGAAIAAATQSLAGEHDRLAALQARLEHAVMQQPGVVVFGRAATRLPNTTLLAVPGLRAETALIALDLAGVAASSGSACSSGKVQSSHVLRAMGTSAEIAQSAIRLSSGYATTEGDIDRYLEAWRKLTPVLSRPDETVLERF